MNITEIYSPSAHIVHNDCRLSRAYNRVANLLRVCFYFTCAVDFNFIFEQAGLGGYNGDGERKMG